MSPPGIPADSDRIIASCAAKVRACPVAMAVCWWIAAACACTAAAAAAAAKPGFMFAIPAAAAIAWKLAMFGTADAVGVGAVCLEDLAEALGLFSRAGRSRAGGAGDGGTLSPPPSARLYLWCPFGFLGIGTNRGRPLGKPFSILGGPSNSALSSAAVTLVLSSSS